MCPLWGRCCLELPHILLLCTWICSWRPVAIKWIIWLHWHLHVDNYSYLLVNCSSCGLVYEASQHLWRKQSPALLIFYMQITHDDVIGGDKNDICTYTVYTVNGLSESMRTRTRFYPPQIWLQTPSQAPPTWPVARRTVDRPWEHSLAGETRRLSPEFVGECGTVHPL